jgi:hypothetical protein
MSCGTPGNIYTFLTDTLGYRVALPVAASCPYLSLAELGICNIAPFTVRMFCITAAQTFYFRYVLELQQKAINWQRLHNNTCIDRHITLNFHET